ncbi:MAG TPA: choice-of-anchor Q domain-containing protein [Verrucomicrobiae bacterium]|nr:choice-of-anchor Q domain-containing protein [Verrucomicrobiae bacterium]
MTLASAATGRSFYLNSRSRPPGDGSLQRPWRDLQPLRETRFNPGDHIYFACGSRFEGGFAVNQPGTAAAPIVFESYGKGVAPRFANPRLESLDGNAIRLNGSHIEVRGLFFERCPANPVPADIHALGAIFLTTNANDCIVRGCEITRTPIGITVYGERNLITRNFIHDNNAPIEPHWGPICVVVCSSTNEISYNRFVNYCAPSKEYGHDGGAIEINDRSLPKEHILIHHNFSLRNQGFIEFVGRVTQDDFIIHHNVCMDYQSFLGLTGPCSNIRVEHNTVVRTLAHEKDDSEDVVFWNYFTNTNISFQNNIFVYNAARVDPVFARGEFHHTYNLYFRAGRPRILPQPNEAAYERKYLGGSAHLREGEIIGDPLFRNLRNGDFHLRPGSPAIDAGTDLHYTRDFDDLPMPMGKAPDMGAFEFGK